jgi:hypothetical protein
LSSFAKGKEAGALKDIPDPVQIESLPDRALSAISSRHSEKLTVHQRRIERRGGALFEIVFIQNE